MKKDVPPLNVIKYFSAVALLTFGRTDATNQPYTWKEACDAVDAIAKYYEPKIDEEDWL